MPAVGSNSPQAKLSNAWKSWSNFWGRHNGTWKRPLSVHVKNNGSWVKVWDNRPLVTNMSVVWNFVPYQGYNVTVRYTITTNTFDTNVTVSRSDGAPFPDPSTITGDQVVNLASFSGNLATQTGTYTVTATNSSGSSTSTVTL